LWDLEASMPRPSHPWPPSLTLGPAYGSVRTSDEPLTDPFPWFPYPITDLTDLSIKLPYARIARVHVWNRQAVSRPVRKRGRRKGPYYGPDGPPRQDFFGICPATVEG